MKKRTDLVEDASFIVFYELYPGSLPGMEALRPRNVAMPAAAEPTCLRVLQLVDPLAIGMQDGLDGTSHLPLMTLVRPEERPVRCNFEAAGRRDGLAGSDHLGEEDRLLGQNLIAQGT